MGNTHQVFTLSEFLPSFIELAKYSLLYPINVIFSAEVNIFCSIEVCILIPKGYSYVLGFILTLLVLAFLVHFGIRGRGTMYRQISKPPLNLKFLSKSNQIKKKGRIGSNLSLMGDGFILLTRGYGFMGGRCTTPILRR